MRVDGNVPLVRVMRYVWAAPATACGVLAGLLGGWHATWAIVDGLLEIEGPAVAWGLRHLLLLPGGAAALTLGHVVLGRDARTLVESRDHEQVHVRQYEVWGPFFLPAYVAASLWAALRGRHYYFDNVFEQEAYGSVATQQAASDLQFDGAFGGDQGARESRFSDSHRRAAVCRASYERLNV